MNLIDDIPGLRPAPDPIAEKIEAALDAGIDVTAAIEALDALSDDPDREPDELEDTVGEVIFLTCECPTCNHRHTLHRGGDPEPGTTIQIL